METFGTKSKTGSHGALWGSHRMRSENGRRPLPQGQGTPAALGDPVQKPNLLQGSGWLDNPGGGAILGSSSSLRESDWPGRVGWQVTREWPTTPEGPGLGSKTAPCRMRQRLQGMYEQPGLRYLPAGLEGARKEQVVPNPPPRCVSAQDAVGRGRRPCFPQASLEVVLPWLCQDPLDELEAAYSSKVHDAESFP